MQSVKDKSLFTKFFPTPKFLTIPSVGIDISDNSIHFIEFAEKHGQRTIKKFGKHTIPSGIIIKGEIKKIKELTDILKKLKKDNNVSFVRASLPEEKAYLFQTQIPGDVTDENIRSILEFKLEEYVPLSPSSAVFDYNILPDQKGSNLLNVVVAVYPKNTIEKYTTAFEEAGMTLLSLEIEAQSIKRSILKDADGGTYMIVDFGKTKTGLSVVSNGVLSFTSTLEVEEERLTNTIVKHLKVSEAEVDRVKNEEGLIKTRNNKELFSDLMSTVESFRDDINKHYRYWQARVDEKGDRVDAIEKIIICGGNSNLAGLPEFLSSSLKVKVERADVWTNVSLFNNSVPEIDSFNSLSYATAIGLALRNTT